MQRILFLEWRIQELAEKWQRTLELAQATAYLYVHLDSYENNNQTNTQISVGNTVKVTNLRAPTKQFDIITQLTTNRVIFCFYDAGRHT